MLVNPTPPATLGAHMEEIHSSVAAIAARNRVLAPLLALVLDCLRRLIALFENFALSAASPARVPAPKPRRRRALRIRTTRPRRRSARRQTIVASARPAAHVPVASAHRIPPSRSAPRPTQRTRDPPRARFAVQNRVAHARPNCYVIVTYAGSTALSDECTTANSGPGATSAASSAGTSASSRTTITG